VGRYLEVYLRESGRRPLREVGNAIPSSDRRLYRLPRDLWGLAGAIRIHDTAHCHSVRHRDDCGHSFDENLALSRDVAIAFAARAAQNRDVGRFARSPFGVCATADVRLSFDQRPRKMVLGRAAPSRETEFCESVRSCSRRLILDPKRVRSPLSANVRNACRCLARLTWRQCCASLER
jgi:hypothetical protein